MKTFTQKLTALSLVLFFSISLYGANNNSIKAELKLKNNEMVEIHFSGNSTQTIGLKVFNDKGEIVFSKCLKNEGHQKLHHNIADFSTGIYTYQVIEGDEVVYSARLIKPDEASVECRNLKCGAMASISELGNKQVLVRLIKDEKAKSTIKVRDENGNLLYVKYIKKGQHLRFTHDISSFPAGTYTFSVYSKNQLIAFRRVIK